MKPSHILETCLYINDLDQAARFYSEVLGLQLHSRRAGRHLFFNCGNQMLLLFDPSISSEENADLPPHGATGPGHLALAALEADLDAWKSHLAAHGVEIEKSIDWPQGGRSIYFRDPAGNSLELASPNIWGVKEEKSSKKSL